MAVDIFLIVVIWLVLDSEKSQAIQVDGDRVYAVVDVINTEISQSTSEGGYNEEEDDRARRSDSMRYSGVSQRMIDQFFNDDEGLDRDWRDQDEDIYGEPDRNQLIVQD